jgi:hypothetical protein
MPRTVKGRLPHVIVAGIVVVLIVSAVIVGTVGSPASDRIVFELRRYFIQFLLIVALGAVVAFLVDDAKRRAATMEEKRRKRQDAAERERQYAIDTVTSLLNQFDAIYRAVKRKRRSLRLVSLSDPTKENNVDGFSCRQPRPCSPAVSDVLAAHGSLPAWSLLDMVGLVGASRAPHLLHDGKAARPIARIDAEQHRVPPSRDDESRRCYSTSLVTGGVAIRAPLSPGVCRWRWRAQQILLPGRSCHHQVRRRRRSRRRNRCQLRLSVAPRQVEMGAGGRPPSAGPRAVS